MYSEINKIRFIPENITENDLELFLDWNKYDILLHESQLKFFIEICDIVNTRKLKGDVVECGVWKGGSAVLLWILLNQGKDKNIERYWLADYFGRNYNFINNNMFPKELETFQKASKLTIYPPTIEDVKLFIDSFNIPKNIFEFIIGDVTETLKKVTIEKICLLHLDLDFYNSTIGALDTLYPNIIDGGIILVSDYNIRNLNCKEAILAFRKKNSINSPIIELGEHMAYWIK